MVVHRRVQPVDGWVSIRPRRPCTFPPTIQNKTKKQKRRKERNEEGDGVGFGVCLVQPKQMDLSILFLSLSFTCPFGIHHRRKEGWSTEPTQPELEKKGSNAVLLPSTSLDLSFFHNQCPNVNIARRGWTHGFGDCLGKSWSWSDMLVWIGKNTIPSNGSKQETKGLHVHTFQHSSAVQGRTNTCMGPYYVLRESITHVYHR